MQSGWSVLGDGSNTTILYVEPVLGSSEDGVIQLAPVSGTTGWQISDLMLSNPNTNGVGVRAAYLSGSAFTINDLQMSRIGMAALAGGVYLPEGEASVENSNFVNVFNTVDYLNDNSPYLDGSLLNIYGENNNIEHLRDIAGYASGYGIKVANETDAATTSILGCDTATGNYLYYDLSGPNIIFLGSYTADPVDDYEIELEGVSNFQADHLGYNNGTGIDSSSGNIYVDFVDEGGSNLSQIINVGDDSSADVHIALLKFASSPTSYGVPDSYLKNINFDIASSYTTVGSTDALADVVVQNVSTGSVTVASSSGDPNELTVSNGSASAINVVSSEDYPYIIGTAHNTTVTLNYSSGINAGTAYFKGASGYTNKLVVDEPSGSRTLTFVQGPPPSDSAGIIGISNVQEIDTGSGSYNVTFDFSGSSVPSNGLYYNASTGSGVTNTLTLKGSTSHNTFSLVSGPPPSGSSSLIGVSNVQTVGLASVSGVNYALTILGTAAADTLGLINDSGLIDVDINTLAPAFAINTTNIGSSGSITLNGDGGADTINVAALPSGVSSYTLTGASGSGTTVNVGGTSSADTFSVGTSTVVISSTTFNLSNIATVDLKGAGGGDTVNVSGTPAYSISFDGGTSGSPTLKLLGGTSNTFAFAGSTATVNGINVSISNVNLATIQGGSGVDTMALSVASGTPAFPILYDGVSGADTLTVTAASGGSAFTVAATSGTTSTITTNFSAANIPTLTINGGSSGNDSLTLNMGSYTPTFTTFTYNGSGGSGDSLTINGTSGADSFTIGSGSVQYATTTARTITFSSVEVLSIYGGSSGADSILIHPSAANTVSYTGGSGGTDTLVAYSQTFSITHIGEIDFEGSSSSDTLEINNPAAPPNATLIDFTASGGADSIEFNGSSANETIDAYAESGDEVLLDNNLKVKFTSVANADINTGGSTGSGDTDTDTFSEGDGSYGPPTTPMSITVPNGSSSTTFNKLKLTTPGGSSTTYISLSGLTVRQYDLVTMDPRTSALSATDKRVLILGTSDVDGLLDIGPYSGTYSTLDLTNQDMIISYDKGDDAPTATYRAYILAAYVSGAWSGQGITSSVAAADGTHSTALGYADNNDLGLTSWDGADTSAANLLLFKYTYYGDANLDGKVNSTDSAMVSAYGSNWSQGDFNYSGSVNSDDWSLFDLGVAEYVSGGSHTIL